MTGSQTPDDRRSQRVALLGCIVQLAAFVLVLMLSLWSGSRTLGALSRFMLIGVPIWFVLYLVLNQIRRVGLEALETTELMKARESGTTQAIFELDDEGLLLEQNRLKWMTAWLLPACTVLVAGMLLGGNFLFWGWSLDEAFAADVIQPSHQATLMMWFVIGMAFICFLYARYALALSRLPQWGLLRGGAVCMAGSALASVLVALGLMAGGTMEWTEPLVAYLIRLTLIVLGLELAVNFVLDLYRPRTPGEVARPSFDSRLLGMIGEPGGIAKSIAEAVNYQFGFHVSSTWFYQLLQRWLFPITVAAMATVLLLTSVVIVDAEDEAVVERFGRRPAEVLSPGIYLKRPFPSDIVYRTPVKQISELVIGEAHEEDDHDEHHAIIWTEAHDYVPELMMLVASPQLDTLAGEKRAAPGQRSSFDGTESVAVSLLMVSVPIEYRINDVHKYLYRYQDPRKVMEAVAYQYLSDYAAGVDIDEMMGPGRTALNRGLGRLIQERLDKLDMGIEIAFVGIRGAHPPAKAKVAATFHSVVSAETQMSALINAADGASQRMLTSVAGNVARAQALDAAILERDGLPVDSPLLSEAKRKVSSLLMGDPAAGIPPISGEAAASIAHARARATETVSRAAAKARVFGTQVAAFLAAPDLYRQRKMLDVYADLDGIRKYLFVGDMSNVVIQYETTKEAGLDQVLSEGVDREKAKQGGRNP